MALRLLGALLKSLVVVVESALILAFRLVVWALQCICAALVVLVPIFLQGCFLLVTGTCKVAAAIIRSLFAPRG